MRPRSKYILLVASMVILLFSGFIPVQASEDPDSYTDTFPLQTFDFRMYVVSLKLGDNLIVNVSSVADGDFDLFLFNTRPKEAYVSRDGYDLEIFNIGNSKIVELRGLIEIIADKLNVKPEIEQLSEQLGDVPITCADISKAKKMLGYNPSTPIGQGIEKFVKWYRERDENLSLDS